MNFSLYSRLLKCSLKIRLSRSSFIICSLDWFVLSWAGTILWPLSVSTNSNLSAPNFSFSIVILLIWPYSSSGSESYRLYSISSSFKLIFIFWGGDTMKGGLLVKTLLLILMLTGRYPVLPEKVWAWRKSSKFWGLLKFTAMLLLSWR